MTRRLDLKEYVRSEPHRLSVTDRDALRAAGMSVTMEPVAGTDGACHHAESFMRTWRNEPPFGRPLAP